MSLRVTPFAGYDHACDCVGRLITSGRKAFSVAVNPEKIQQAANDPALAALINRAQMFIDGIGAALEVRLLHGIPGRKTAHAPPRATDGNPALVSSPERHPVPPSG
jgi:UDP-N-acetyl-D-mannosaminuronic acid transferase (WecB/TagA/CpsF family)